MSEPRILIVEDDALVGELLGAMLETMGYDVCGIEATEAGAVNAAAQHQPDLMIVDVALSGGGSGASAVDQILRAGFVPHLFMSGNIAKIMALRPDAVVLQKPFNEAQLLPAIRRALTGTAH
jgi:CheY-like chemotaxis protein